MLVLKISDVQIVVLKYQVYEDFKDYEEGRNKRYLK